MTTKKESGTAETTQATGISADVIMPPAPTMPVAFEAANLEKLYKQVEEEVTAELTEIDTVAGRKRIKELAAMISKSRKAIDDPIRDHLRIIKAQPKILEKNARESVERFDALREKTLAPLMAALAPQRAIISRMTDIVSLCNDVSATSDTVRSMLDEANAVDTSKMWPELVKEADAAVDGAKQIATDALARIETAEKQAAELAELRRQQAENEQKERDRLIADAAAQKARDEEQQRAEQRILDERNKAEQSRLAQLKAEQHDKDNEARRVAQEEQAKRDVIAAEEAAKQREALAAKEATEKAVREAEEKRKREAEETERREADKAHRTLINRAALVDLIAQAGIDEDTAKKVITAVAQGKVANMKVVY